MREQSLSDAASKCIAGAITERGGNEEDQSKHVDIGMQQIEMHEESSRKQQAVTRQEKADQQAGFGKDDSSDTSDPDQRDEPLDAVMVECEVRQTAEE